MSTIDLGIAERTPDVRSHTEVASAPATRPAPLNDVAVQQADDCFYVGSVKIEPLEHPQPSTTGSLTA